MNLFLQRVMMLWKKFIICRKSKERRETFKAIKIRNFERIFLRRKCLKLLSIMCGNRKVKWRTSPAPSMSTTKANDIFEFTLEAILILKLIYSPLVWSERQQSPPKTKWYVINAEKFSRKPLILQLCCCCVDKGWNLIETWNVCAILRRP